jgi:ribosome-binding factor A|tara:strand:+ start:410 stop:808 length:399 start_codon:yes stop_codon:yes gene_type:complete
LNDFSLDFPRGKASQRQMKVQEILRAALVEILQRGLTKEPVLDNSMITITYVDVSPDLKHAKFIFLPFDEEKKDDFIKSFKRANKRIRKEIAQRVQLKYTPNLSFVFDDTIKEIRKLDELFSSSKVSNDLKS